MYQIMKLYFSTRKTKMYCTMHKNNNIFQHMRQGRGQNVNYHLQ